MDCGDLLAPTNGSVTLTGTVEGSVANYTCDEGFLPDESVVRMCGSNGMWSGSTPQCEGELDGLKSRRTKMISLKCRSDRLW